MLLISSKEQETLNFLGTCNSGSKKILYLHSNSRPKQITLLKKNTDYTPDQVPDFSLAASIREGNQAAWEQVVHQYYQMLFGFILSMVKEPATAEELVQDVFANFWAKREQISITVSLKAYLYRAARNHTINYLKRRKFEQEYQHQLAGQMAARQMAGQSEDTETAFHFSELEKKLYAAIEALPDSCREIFKLSRFEQMTYKEIAETLEIPVRSVHYQIGLALKELRDELKDMVNPGLLG